MNIGAVSSEALGSDRGHRCELEGHEGSSPTVVT